MPSTNALPSIYCTSGTSTSDNYRRLYTIDSESITAYSTPTSVLASYKFVVDDKAKLDLLQNTGQIDGSNCVYIVDNIACGSAITGTSWTVSTRMLPDDSNIELQNLILSAAEGDEASGQTLQYIASSDTSNYFGVMLYGSAFRELTDQQREELEQICRDREQFLRDREQLMERDAMLRANATHRAIHLLWEHLSPSQKRSLKKNGWFDVLSKCGIKYRLLYTLHGNVLRLGSKNKVEQAFCGHMGANIPIADTLLAQKLLLRHNPGKYEKSANKVNYEHTSWCRPQKQFADEIISALNTPLPLHPQELMPV